MNTSKDQVYHSWAKLLNPESLRGNLIAASIFLAAYELLRTSVIDRIRVFFTYEFNEHGGSIYELLTKIERWWIREVDIPTNSDFDDQEVADDDIQAGMMLCMQMMVTIATDENASVFWDEFQKQPVDFS